MSYFPDSLKGTSVLVVEDQYYLADHFQSIIESAGGQVTGPYGDVATTLDYLATPSRCVTAASLDITLTDGTVYAVADRLVELEIPFLFATGREQADIPDRFAHAPIIRKPLSPNELVSVLVRLAE